MCHYSDASVGKRLSQNIKKIDNTNTTLVYFDI